MTGRFWGLVLLIAGGLAAVGWATLGVKLPPADFTFCNEAEVKSLDNCVATGQPEHRIISAMFEGLTRLDPKDSHPIPGVAESWDISEDKRTYTFHLRKDARWSNGDPVTAHDFLFGLQRMINPMTAAEYAYQSWYIKNAKRYSFGAKGIEPGDAVEVELNERAEGALTFARGKLVYGNLVRIDGESAARVFVVSIDGKERKFRAGDSTDEEDNEGEGVEPCKQVLLDFREVGVRAIDDYTLETTLEDPTPFWLALIAYHAMLPANRTCLETFGMPRWTDSENIVVNGPYKVSFRRIRDRTRLVKNDMYWDRDNVKLNVIDALAVSSQVTMFNLYETNKCDWITWPPAIVLRELLKEGSQRTDLKPRPFFCTYFYALNLNKKPLDDVRVRRALSLALDRREITKTATGAGELPALSFVPPGLPSYESPSLGEQNIAEAQRLLAEAGYPNGEGFPNLELLYNTDQSHQTIAQLVRKQWERNLGITITTRNEEWGSYQNSFREMQFDISRRAWIGDYPDPNTFLDCMLTDGENNCTGWSNAEYDQLIADARTEVDENKRLKLLQRAEDILLAEVPIIPIYTYVDKNMVKPYVRGFYGNLLDVHPLNAIWVDHDLKELNEFMSY